jgi:hypothetical protein
VLSDAGWHVVLRVATPGIGDAADRIQASCDLLGIDEWDWLSKDRWVDDGGRSGPQTLASAEPREVAAAVEKAINEVSPQLVLTVGTDGLTGHPDHIAISRAVQRQQQCHALGARLRSQDVQAGHQYLQQLLPGEQIGSGHVTGCTTPLQEISGASELRRRQALDQYYKGLGTTDIPDLITTYGRRGDSLLLRAVFDASGWHTDRFEVLSPSGSDVPSFP